MEDVGNLYKNIFHFTNGGDGGKQHGERTPAMWVKDQSFLIVFNTDVEMEYPLYQPVPLNKKISFKIEQVLLSEIPTVRVFIDEKLIRQVTHNLKTPFTNVKFYLGDPWYDPAPVKISNLKYEQHP